MSLNSKKQINTIDTTVKISLYVFHKKMVSEGHVEQLELQSIMSGVEIFLLSSFPV